MASPTIVSQESKTYTPDLSFLNLNGRDLRGANFEGANLGDTTFDGAVLDGVDLRNIIYTKTDLFRNASLVGALFTEEDVNKLNLDERQIGDIMMETKLPARDLS